jgi:hypothetical protein
MIFYLISSISKNNPGLGGHYFSLMHIAEAVSEEKDVAIVNIGTKKAKGLNSWGGSLFYIETHCTGQKFDVLTISS